MPAIKKPLKMRRLEGNRSRVAIPDEPVLTAGELAMPDCMPADAKRFWQDIVPLLRRELGMGKIDEPSALLMAIAYGFALQAARKMRREGLTADGQQGETKKHPAAQMFRDNAVLFAQFAGRFGMTPADRARIMTAGQEKQSQDDVLNGNWSPRENSDVRPN